MTEQPPAELLRRLRPIPTYRDHPATSASDIEGVDPHGTPRAIAIGGSTEPVLLLFLSAACLGCRDLWQGMAEMRHSLPEGVHVVVVTHGPEQEDAEAIAALSAPETDVVMSSQAYVDYRVGGPPFLVVVVGQEVRTEGVAWGIAETVRTVGRALDS